MGPYTGMDRAGALYTGGSYGDRGQDSVQEGLEPEACTEGDLYSEVQGILGNGYMGPLLLTE